MANDRLRRQISFSQHEKDIYDYLDECNNASALVKRLVREHMLLEKLTKQGVIEKGSIVVDLSNHDDEYKEEKKTSKKETKIEETYKEVEEEIAIDKIEEDIDLNEKDKENKNLIDNLPF
ncbi:hypothetical protein UT300009_30680 [Paraclostridium bifermentans]